MKKKNANLNNFDAINFFLLLGHAKFKSEQERKKEKRPIVGTEGLNLAAVPIAY